MLFLSCCFKGEFAIVGDTSHAVSGLKLRLQLNFGSSMNAKVHSYII